MLQMDTRTDRQMQGQCENSIPTTNKVGGCIKMSELICWIQITIYTMDYSDFIACSFSEIL